jgi:hypothetical protein
MIIGCRCLATDGLKHSLEVGSRESHGMLASARAVGSVVVPRPEMLERQGHLEVEERYPNGWHDGEPADACLLARVRIHGSRLYALRAK